MEKNSIYLSSH